MLRPGLRSVLCTIGWLSLTIVGCNNAPVPTHAGPPVAASSMPTTASVATEPPPVATTRTTSDASTATPPAPPPKALPPVAAVTVTPRKPSGKLAKLKWAYGNCENTGSYDTGRYTEAELRATLTLLQAPYLPTVSAQTTRPQLDVELETAFESVSKLSIVADQRWETHRAVTLTQMQQRHQLAVSELESRTDPQRLRAHPAFATCRRFAEPLMASTDEALLEGWRALANEERVKPGASPFWKEVEASSREAGAAKKAREELLMFGWHNCVNALVPASPSSDRDFDKLFSRVTHDCDT